MKKPSSVEEFIANYPMWNKELTYLRQLLQDTHMQESIKWQFPTYSHHEKNVVSIFATKTYAGLWFFQGVFLIDEQQKLFKAQTKTKGLRQWRFNAIKEIQRETDLIRAYIQEAMHNSEQGKELKPTRNTQALIVGETLQAFFQEKPLVKEAFDLLTLAKQRAYAEYIHTAKRATTKQSRLVKIEPLILSGKGLNDQYK